jgi:crotonobetainyl-CoA:carnitine CoA-transferase CaiB-like acyl-CoA transferase
LDGVRVLDASRLMPFSYTTHLLVEAGAEVVKLESPGGEYGRSMPAIFALFNRGKRSITVDLRTDEGRTILLELVAQFDVFFESFRPGYLNGLGLGYGQLVANRPDLVYCSATGYGGTGPHARRAGHDLNYQALAGLLSPSGAVPIVAPVPYLDMAGGLAAAFAIMTALVGVRSTGRGCHLDVGMSDVAMSFNALAVAETVGRPTGSPAVTEGPLASYPWPGLALGECPCYGVFLTSDDRYIALANVEPKFWSTFVEVIGREDLEDARFLTGAAGAAVRAEIADIIRTNTLDYWDVHFGGFDVCYAPVLSTAEAYLQEQFRGRVIPDDGRSVAETGPRSSLPFVIGGRPPAGFGQVPEAGEANDSILAGLGYDDAERRRLTDAGVI